jgi:hypothetical protein
VNVLLEIWKSWFDVGKIVYSLNFWNNVASNKLWTLKRRSWSLDECNMTTYWKKFDKYPLVAKLKIKSWIFHFFYKSNLSPSLLRQTSYIECEYSGLMSLLQWPLVIVAREMIQCWSLHCSNIPTIWQSQHWLGQCSSQERWSNDDCYTVQTVTQLVVSFVLYIVGIIHS